VNRGIITIDSVARVGTAICESRGIRIVNAMVAWLEGCDSYSAFDLNQLRSTLMDY